MRICMDFQPAVAQCAGIGRYTRVLASEVVKCLAPEDSLRLFYCDFRRNLKNGVNIAGAENAAFRLLPGAVMQKMWRKFGFPPYDYFAGNADLFHFTNFVAYPVRRGGKSVVTIHDMSFERFPEFTEEKNLRYLRSAIKKSINRADSIIAISEFSRKEIEELFPESRGKVHVTHLGISDDFARVPDDEIAAVKKLLGLDRPFMLTVGTIEPRKNLSFLIDVFDRMADMEVDLVIAGAPGWKYESIMERFKSVKHPERFHYVNFVPDGKLAALYSAADLFVVPSYYEGFGFPPLEAMACGTPVVSSTGGSLPEVLGGAAKVIDGFSADEWADSLTKMFSDSARRAEMIEAGKKRAAVFRWNTTAEQTVEIYKKTLES